VPIVFPRRAPVSPNESAVNAQLTEARLNRMPPWADSLATYVASLIAAADG
jgi:hypothetical protein